MRTLRAMQGGPDRDCELPPDSQRTFKNPAAAHTLFASLGVTMATVAPPPRHESGRLVVVSKLFEQLFIIESRYVEQKRLIAREATRV